MKLKICTFQKCRMGPLINIKNADITKNWQNGQQSILLSLSNINFYKYFGGL